MAFKPSDKKKRAPESIEPNITPIMNLMVVLIPMLLSAARLTELSLLEYLPPAETSTTGSGASSEPPEESIEKLNLLINIQPENIQVSIYQSVDLGPNFFEIPIKSDAHDWETLKDSLILIKQREVGEPVGTLSVMDERSGEMKTIPKYRFSDGEEVSIAADGGIPFQTIIRAMDACKYYVDGKAMKPLFPITLLKQFQ
ncbi:MAG: hypothetical protein HN356_04040 [Calditrichaeota bacterium]|nr:hypothetical protein [Calditrichota bacterium]MBT7617393.1 hypothetical protein [Calditrichota bacterium]MBT7789322.1 hypothetical protein [Calditrichota bacterium]